MLKVVVKTQEPKETPKPELIVGGVYKARFGGYRLVVAVDGEPIAIDLSSFRQSSRGGAARGMVADGDYVLVDATLTIEEAN
jgi:hypothetical protein